MQDFSPKMKKTNILINLDNFASETVKSLPKQSRIQQNKKQYSKNIALSENAVKANTFVTIQSENLQIISKYNKKRNRSNSSLKNLLFKEAKNVEN